MPVVVDCGRRESFSTDLWLLFRFTVLISVFLFSKPRHLFVETFAKGKPLSFYFHPIPASDSLTVEFALDVRRDPEFGGVPEVIHLSGEVLGELG